MILNYAKSLQFRKLSLALSMQNELTYIGPESVGPHYLESGKRPDGDKTRVIIQRQDGTIVPGTWFSDTQGFYTEGGWTIPACWWHLPAAAPMTEREWFHEQFKCDEDGYFEYKDYSAKLNLDFDLRHKYELLGGFDRLRDATGAAYQHWVEAGRP